MKPNYYDDLGVTRDATAEQLKAAWRAAALKHSPDHGGDAQVFRRCRVAYDVLSDPSARAQYDATGEVAPDLLTRILAGIDAELLQARDAFRERRILDGVDHVTKLVRRGAQRFGWKL